jgi:hypothetical protein
MMLQDYLIENQIIFLATFFFYGIILYILT